MITVARVGNGTDAQRYYEKDDKALDYYMHDNTEVSSQGIWYGKLKDNLHLSDKVEYEQFLHLANGYIAKDKPLVMSAGRKGEEILITAKNGETFLITKGKHRAGVDLTMSAPKSVSVLSLIDKNIVTAFDKSVKATLDMIERDYIATRTQVNHEKVIENTSKMLSSVFTHMTSRENDPQLHSHCVVLNITQDSNGKYKTTHMDEIYKDQKIIGQYMRMELAHNLRELGYKIEITDAKNGLFEIAGVDKQIIETFSTRTSKINEKITELKSNPKYENMEEWKIRKTATLDTRKDKQEISLADLKKSVNYELENHNMTLTRLRDKALEVETVKDTYTAQEYVKQAITDITDMNSVFNEKKVISVASKYAIENYTNKELSEAFNELKNTDMLVTLDSSNYSTMKVISAEKSVIDIAVSEPNKLQVTELKGVDHKIHVTDSQNRFIESALNTEMMVTVVQGDAGTGKTTAVKIIADTFKESGINVRGLAPTGNAAHELSQSADIDSMTVHKFMNYDSKWCDENIKSGKEVWVLDESGMMGSIRLNSVFERAKQYDVNIILIGDKKQFMPIEQGRIFTDLQDHKAKLNYVEMNDVVRQKTDYTKMAVESLTPDSVGNTFKILKENDKIYEINDKQSRYKQVAEAYFNDTRDSKLIITSRNIDKNEINAIIRSRLITHGSVEHGLKVNTFQHEKLTAEQKKYAVSYDAVDGKNKVIYISKTIDDKLKQGLQATVVCASQDKRSITVEYIKNGQRQLVDIDTYKYGDHINVYRQEERSFGKGDKVIFLKNDNMLELKNGFTGTVQNIKDNGDMTVSLNGLKSVTVNVNNEGKNAYNYIDHAYAVTEYKSQGATVDHLIWDVDANNQTHFNNTYVALTRAREDITVITNDTKKLVTNAKEMQQKSSTIGYDIPDVTTKADKTNEHDTGKTVDTVKEMSITL